MSPFVTLFNTLSAHQSVKCAYLTPEIRLDCMIASLAGPEPYGYSL